MYDHADGLMQKRYNLIAKALGLHLFCIKQSIWYHLKLTKFTIYLSTAYGVVRSMTILTIAWTKWHFADNICKNIFLNENEYILIEI